MYLLAFILTFLDLSTHISLKHFTGKLQRRPTIQNKHQLTNTNTINVS